MNGPIPAGSSASLPQSTPGGCSDGVDRDWRDIRILPVTLVDFKGNLNNGQVKLSWTVTSESNMSHYTVERSVNGTSFVEIGKVNAIANGRSGNTTYNLNDDVSSLTNTTVYYRLKSVEAAGSARTSNVLNFKLNNKSGYALGVYPNPATAYFTVKVNTVKDGTATIRITDFAGRVIMSQNQRVSTGSNPIMFTNLNNVAGGTYNVQVLINGEVLNEKLIIVK
jgi:hypothetical protein